MSLNVVLEVKLEWLGRRLELSLVYILRVHCSAHKGEIIQVIYTMHRALLTWCKGGPFPLSPTELEHLIKSKRSIIR